MTKVDVCPKCKGEIEEIGQEIIDMVHSIYVYECKSCHYIIRLIHRVIKPKKIWCVS